jgi:uncharacterized protein YneF (UPF0154 family)
MFVYDHNITEIMLILKVHLGLLVGFWWLNDKMMKELMNLPCVKQENVLYLY